VWRPRRLGSIIAERRLKLVRRRKPARTVVVRFGRPVRSPRPERNDPWWCPVEITGLGKRTLKSIAGEDSLQTLVLAFQFVTLVLPAEAERAGGRIEWLDERESLVFANTLLLNMASEALENLVGGLAKAVGVLENRDTRHGAATRKVARQLRALIASGGYTSDHRRVPKPSNSALEADAPRRRAAQRER